MNSMKKSSQKLPVFSFSSVLHTCFEAYALHQSNYLEWSNKPFCWIVSGQIKLYCIFNSALAIKALSKDFSFKFFGNYNLLLLL
jgi:hypothetical protein